MEITKEEKKEYSLVYDVHGAKYAFPCDEYGNILWDKFSYSESIQAQMILAYCKAHQKEKKTTDK